MKTLARFRTFIVVAASLCAATLSCSQFPTSLGYIGDQYVQTVGFVFTPLAEGAPGDTIHMHAYFAGEPVRSYACSISTHYSITLYGSDTAIDFGPLVDPQASFTPDSILLSFVIPDTIFAGMGPLVLSTLAAIPDSEKAKLGLDSAVVNHVPSSQLAAFIGRFLTATDFSTQDSLVCQQVAHLSEILSTQIVLHLAVNGGYSITRNITVRYNSKIHNDQYIFVNKNPDPWWLGILKVRNLKKQLFSTFERDSDDTIFCLYAKDTSVVAGPKRFTDTIFIDTGFTYYAAGDSGIAGGINHCDSAYTNEGVFTQEIYGYLWFYLPDSGTTDLNPQNALSISNGRGYYSSMSLPLDTAMHNFTLWARASESASGELNAPTSTSVREIHAVFQYSAAYAGTVKKL